MALISKMDRRGSERAEISNSPDHGDPVKLPLECSMHDLRSARAAKRAARLHKEDTPEIVTLTHRVNTLI